MNKLFYPALFHKAEEGGFWISFPDFPGAFTEGDTMEDAYKMAIDCLGLAITSMQSEKQSLPNPSSPDTIEVEKNTFLVIVEFDLLAYKKRNSQCSVKKTLTIPEWLNEEALAMNLNFSQILQDALLQKISGK